MIRTDEMMYGGDGLSVTVWSQAPDRQPRVQGGQGATKRDCVFGVRVHLTDRQTDIREAHKISRATFG